MKLKDYADKVGIKYLTAYRWFKEGKLPVPAYQTATGTIIVQDEEGSVMQTNSNEVISQFLKKTVEFSKTNASIEDFAAYILSNFSLLDNSKTSMKPMKVPEEVISQDVQNHYKNIINSITSANSNITSQTSSQNNILDIINNVVARTKPEDQIFSSSDIKALTDQINSLSDKCNPSIGISLNDSNRVANTLTLSDNMNFSTPNINYNGCMNLGLSNETPFNTQFSTTPISSHTMAANNIPTPDPEVSEQVVKELYKAANQMRALIKKPKSKRGRKPSNKK